MTIAGGPHFLATDTKKIPDDTMDRKKTLGMSGGLEPPHLPLSMANGFMGYFGSVVRSPTRSVRNCRHHLTMGYAVAFELIRNQAIRFVACPFSSLRKNRLAARPSRRDCTTASVFGAELSGRLADGLEG